MPFVDADNDIQSTRKRRRDHDDHCHGSSVYRLYEGDKLDHDRSHDQDFCLLSPPPQQDHILLSPSPRRVIVPHPCSKSKRVRLLTDHGEAANLPVHRRRASLQQKPQGVEHSDRGGRMRTPAVLSPCYICHRRPTKKSDLDSFAQCEGCRERACFVCLRECPRWEALLSEEEVFPPCFHMDGDEDDGRGGGGEARRWGPPHQMETCVVDAAPCAKGWAASGHRAVVCSRCCVERGAEGEVVCLGCLAGMPIPGG